MILVLTWILDGVKHFKVKKHSKGRSLYLLPPYYIDSTLSTTVDRFISLIATL